MKHLTVFDINQAQRDDLINRLQTAVPGTDGLYRVVLNATETQRLTVLKHFNTEPTVPPVVESSDFLVVPPAQSITDKLGDVYSLSDGFVLKNGVPAFDWRGQMIAWIGGELYIRSMRQWYLTDREMGSLTPCHNPLPHHCHHW